MLEKIWMKFFFHHGEILFRKKSMIFLKKYFRKKYFHQNFQQKIFWKNQEKNSDFLQEKSRQKIRKIRIFCRLLDFLSTFFFLEKINFSRCNYFHWDSFGRHLGEPEISSNLQFFGEILYTTRNLIFPEPQCFFFDLL